MTIAPRRLKVIPYKLPMYLSMEPYRENHAQEVIELPLYFAYRKTTGTDKRVRIWANEYGWNTLYYIPSLPKGKVEPVEVDSVLHLQRAGSNTSQSLEEYWEANYKSFVEGQTYTLSRYSFDILTTEELDAIASSTFHYSDLPQSDSFKY